MEVGGRSYADIAKYRRKVPDAKHLEFPLYQSRLLMTMASSRMEADKQRSEDTLPGSSEERQDSESHDSNDEMADPTERDREILFEEEEREKLLGKRHSGRTLERTGNSSRGVRKRKKRQRGEKAELIFEMEEGGLRDDSGSRSVSSLLELEKEPQDDGEGAEVG